MKKNNLIKIIGLLLIPAVFLSSCGSKKVETNNEPTPTVTKLIELKPEEQPYIKLIPRADGHELKLVVQKINSNVNKIEYELIYTAQDNGMEIEKGVSGDIPVTNGSGQKDLLLGTSSCTNGCKYKYDTGVSSGSLLLTLINNSGQVSTYETPFALKSATELKKDKTIGLPSENFSTPVAAKTGEFYTIIKNAMAYSVFSSNSSNPLVSETPFE